MSGFTQVHPTDIAEECDIRVAVAAAVEHFLVIHQLAAPIALVVRPRAAVTPTLAAVRVAGRENNWSASTSGVIRY